MTAKHLTLEIRNLRPGRRNYTTWMWAGFIVLALSFGSFALSRATFGEEESVGTTVKKNAREGMHKAKVAKSQAEEAVRDHTGNHSEIKDKKANIKNGADKVENSAKHMKDKAEDQADH